jgi:uncharacterized protein (DUF4415 family)
MSAKPKKSVRSSPDSDEVPEITVEWIEGADFRKGKTLIRRGRPPLANPKQLLSLRLPPEVIAGWKATGPGWQTRMADVLKKSTPKTRRHVG